MEEMKYFRHLGVALVANVTMEVEASHMVGVEAKGLGDLREISKRGP